MDSLKTLVVIATYNEKENIKPMITQVFANLPQANILVIDDNSPDETYTIVEELQRDSYHEQLILLKRPGKMGLGTAYVAGFNYALTHGYEYIIQMDADFSHNPKYLPELMKQIKDNDLVIGSRYVAGGGVVNWGILRKIISFGGSTYARLVLGLKVRDLTGGFKCWRSTTLAKIGINTLKSNGYSFQVETTYRTSCLGLKVKEIPIIFEDRRVGQSKMSGAIFIEAALMVLKLRFASKNFC